MDNPAVQCEPDLPAVFGLTADALRELLADWGEPGYRAGQVLEWVYVHGARSFADMTNLSKTLRQRLAEGVRLYQSTTIADTVSTDGTRKLLLGWADGQTTECVLIPDEDRRTACLSTQVGCPVGCAFCASGLGGLQRQLTAAEIVEQAMRIRQLGGPDERLSNIVLMGLGEPLANYDNTVRAVRIINAPWGLNIGARKITISTIGLPQPIRRLADEQMQINLALSLHAPTDELRAELIPWARGIPIADLLDACAYYFDRTGREVTIEYILLGGLNDTPDCAAELARLCRRIRSNVNLICYNPVPDLPFQRPTAESAQAFLARLRDRGVNTHLRRSRGQDINGACGQLRRRQSDPRAQG